MKRFFALCLVVVAFATAPAFAGLYTGAVAYEKGDYATALAEFQPLAEQGDSKAQNALGWMYYQGHGVPQDYKQAVKWYALSVEQGNADAQVNLGLMYDQGKGVPQDYKLAFLLYKIVAEQGRAEAQNNLGVMYGEGKGVLQDLVLAHMWFNLAASNGYNPAVAVRDTIAGDMTHAELEKAQDLARACVANNYKGC